MGRSDSLKRPETHMVHVRRMEELHKSLGIHATESDTALQDWGVVVLMAGGVFVVEELRKLIAPRIFNRGKQDRGYC